MQLGHRHGRQRQTFHGPRHAAPGVDTDSCRALSAVDDIGVSVHDTAKACTFSKFRSSVFLVPLFSLP